MRICKCSTLGEMSAARTLSRAGLPHEHARSRALMFTVECLSRRARFAMVLVLDKPGAHI